MTVNDFEYEFLINDFFTHISKSLSKVSWSMSTPRFFRTALKLCFEIVPLLKKKSNKPNMKETIFPRSLWLGWWKLRQRTLYAGGIWKRSFNSPVRPSVHINPSRKRSFPKMLFKLASRFRVDVKHLKMKLFVKDDGVAQSRQSLTHYFWREVKQIPCAEVASQVAYTSNVFSQLLEKSRSY